MNLYYAVSNYHILCCALHVIKKHNGEKNVLYISKWNPKHTKLRESIKSTHIFNDVKIYNEIEYPSKNKKISSVKIRKDINYILDNIPNDFIEDVARSSEINICGDHYSCSIYLIQSKIKYNYFEDASGILSNKERLFKYIKEIEYSRYQIMKFLKLPGEHKYILNRYGNLKKQTEGYFNSKDIDFSVDRILSQIDNETIQKIYSIFSSENFNVKDNSDLFLTFHYSNLGILSIESQRVFYSLLLDYFCGNEKLFIKPHPSDIQPDYKKWFSSSEVLPYSMPSELLPYLSKKGFNKIITSYSTSIYSLEKYCNRIVCFDENIDKEYYSFHQYSFVASLIKHVYLKAGIDTIYYLANKKILENFVVDNDLSNVKCVDISLPINGKVKNSIIVVDRKYCQDNNVLNSLKHNNTVFLINEKMNTIISNELYSDKIYLFNLNKYNNNIAKEVLLDEFDSEQIFVISPFLDMIGILSNFKYLKKLKYINIIIDSRFYSLSGYLHVFNNNLKDECNLLNKKILYTKEKLKDYDKIIDDNNKINRQLEQYKTDIHILQQKYNDIINSSSWKLTSFYRKIGAFIKKRRIFNNKKED